jgi:AcrR family transcriptional regulator
MHEDRSGAAPSKRSLLLAADLTPGAAANDAACLSAGLAAARPGWAGRPLVDVGGLASMASSHLPIAILRAAPKQLRTVVQRLAEGPVDPDATVSLSPAYAQSVHDAETYWRRYAARTHVGQDSLGLGLGLGLQGPRRWVARFSAGLPLWR